MKTMMQTLLLVSSAFSHGFLVHPGQLTGTPGVRNYAAISTAIDSLRSPFASSPAAAFSDDSHLCRGASKGPVTPISVKNGADFTITMAFSNGAQHVGPCAVQIMEDGDLSSAVTISPPGECARTPIAQSDTDKGLPASNQCSGRLPPNLVTDDMCLNTWTFKVINADKIKCTNCVLRWKWAAEHVLPTRENYENCADVSLDGVASAAPAQNSQLLKNAQVSTNGQAQQPKPQDIAAPEPASDPAPAVQQDTSPLLTQGKDSACVGRMQYACASDGGFHVCFPGVDRPSIPMQCAAGTKCKQNGDFMVCDFA
jgi:hypothetical protein